MTRSDATGRDSASQPFSWKLCFTSLASVCLVAGLAALLVGAVWGMRPLERRAVAMGARDLARIRIDWPRAKSLDDGRFVTWIPQRQREEVLALAESALAGDTERFGSDTVSRVGQAMATSGWFVGKPAVEREPNATIAIGGSWRVPAAMVRRDGADQLLSWDGFPMPLSTAPGQTNFPVIASPAMPAPRNSAGAVDYTSAWAGEDIAAGLELLQVLLRQPWAAQVSGVDVGGYSQGKTLTILTVFGTRVVWGGRVTRPNVGEVATERKLAHVDRLFGQHRRIDAGYPMIYVNNNRLQLDISATAQALREAHERLAQPGPLFAVAPPAGQR